MLDFRIQGLDILPDTVGYVLFALAFHVLASNSEHFAKAFKLNIPMIILSIFSIYEERIQSSSISSMEISINFGRFGILGVLISLASMILGLMIVYHLFMGIKDMSSNVHWDLYEEADKRWNQYLMLQIAVLLGFIVIFIPLLNFVYVIGVFASSITLMFIILGFMKRCGEKL